MANLVLDKVVKKFGGSTVVHDFDLTVESGEFLVVVGPSGCGKSTLLRLVAGLEQVNAGDIKIDGRSVRKLSPKARGVSMVFQNYALYPHMTVRDNISFGLKLAKIPDDEIRRRLTDAAKILQLIDLLDRKPHQLSGGQKQRVAMGRAMVRQPAIFLFDEPLSNLDAQLRVQMRSEIASLHRRLNSTVVYVTHDQTEAMTLADRIAVMKEGRLEQLAPPMELYRNPVSRFVASFIGSPSMNFLPVSAFPAGTGMYRAEWIGFRPEHATFVPLKSRGNPGTGEEAILLGTSGVKLVEPTGALTYVHCEMAPGLDAVCEFRDTRLPMPGDEGFIKISANELMFFDGAGFRISDQKYDGKRK
jgi:ABC-type sugar transport system ATPase subunit